MRDLRRVLPLTLALLCLPTPAIAGEPAAALAVAVPADCGGGVAHLVQASDDPATIVAVTVVGVDTACDGQPVDVVVAGNDAGDPAAVASALASASSDVDCDGAVRAAGVLVDGAVHVPLCAPVDGRRVTALRLLTPVGAADVPVQPGPAPAPAPDAPPVPTPDPAPGELPTSGAAIVRAVVEGIGLVLLGALLLRRRPTMRRG